MSLSTTGPNTATPAPLAPSTDKGIPLPVSHSGAQATALSRPAPTPPDQRIPFTAVLDATALQNARGRASTRCVEENRDRLAQELCRPDGPDVNQVKQCLQALIAENKRFLHLEDEKPEKLALYMGFGHQDPTRTAAFSGALSERAKTLQPRLNDPDCEQMLGWVAKDWEVYGHRPEQERARPSKAHAYRKPVQRSTSESSRSMPRPKPTGAWQEHTASGGGGGRGLVEIGPQRRESDARSNTSQTTTNTTTHTTATATSTATAWTTTTTTTITGTTTTDMVSAQDPVTLLMLVHVRDGLLKAAESRNYKTVDELLKKIPPEVKDLTTYLPAAAPDGTYDHARHADWAHQYVAANSAFGMLVRYLEDAGLRAQRVTTLNEDMRKYLAMEVAYAPGVRNICAEMSATHETRLKAGARSIEQKMDVALQDKSLVEHLAAQPFAHLHMLLHKCTLLQPHMNTVTLAAFRKAVENAAAQQRDAGTLLCKELLKSPIDESRVKRLALQDYARVITASPTEPLGSAADGDQIDALHTQINAMHTQIDALITRLVRGYDFNTTDAEIVALNAARSRLKETLDSIL